jgi:tripartite-type tricarboxylate transporter receptor subunit TctC
VAVRWLTEGMRLHHITTQLLALAFAIPPAFAENQPDRQAPLRIVVSAPAGGISDRIARLLAERLQPDLSRPVFVENKAGAGGRIAVDVLMRSAPDGSTVMLVPIIVPVIGPLVFKDLSYNPTRDMAPVSQVATYQLAFAVATQHPARTLREFVAWAKENPRQATFGTPAAGSLAHFLGVALGRESGTELVHVPYQGAGQLAIDLVGGEVASGIAALSDLAPHHREGRLRILATSGAERSMLLPAVPTFREQGFETAQATGWHAVYAPAATPAQVIDRLSGAIVAALESPELRAKLVALGVEPTGTTPEQLAAIMAADTAHWAPIIKAAGFNAPRQ